MGENGTKFDLSFLNKISGGDNNFIVEMLTTFKEMTPEFIENSKRYYEQKDYQALSKEAHKFVTGVSFLGIKELEKNLQFIEEYAKKEENINQLGGLLDEAIEQINEIIVIFNKEFNLS